VSAPELPPEVVYLLERGDKVQATKELARHERISLGEALKKISFYTGKAEMPKHPEPSEIVRGIASMLDHPSVYMGGPSRMAIRKAEKIVDYLRESGVEV